MKSLALLLALLIPLTSDAHAADDDLYKWCVTSYIDNPNTPKPGKYETFNAIKKVVTCTYFRNAPSGSTFTGEQTIPGGGSLDADVTELSCKDLNQRIAALELRRTQLDLAIANALDALTVTVGAANQARVVEDQFYAAWSRSHQGCMIARSNFQAAVDGTLRAQCNAIANREERADCLENLIDGLMEGRNGAAMQTACDRETTDQTLWGSARDQTYALLATEDQIRADIDRDQKMSANLTSAIRKAKAGLKTCTN